MNCTACADKGCRAGRACGAESTDEMEILARYRQEDTQSIVRSAARLVDDGLAGSLSRLEELCRFIKDRDYRRVGMAYCYGMEKEAQRTVRYFSQNGIRVTAVSCTVGALPQNVVNAESAVCGVSCNPLGQAAQLEAEGTDLAIQFGLCLGHDILFARAFPGDQTVLVVKDRIFGQRQLM